MQEMQICLQLLTPALQPDEEVLQAVAPLQRSAPC